MQTRLFNIEPLIEARELLDRAFEKGIVKGDGCGVYYRGIKIGRSRYDAENNLRQNKNGWLDALNTEVGDAFDG